MFRRILPTINKTGLRPKILLSDIVINTIKSTTPLYKDEEYIENKPTKIYKSYHEELEYIKYKNNFCIKVDPTKYTTSFGSELEYIKFKNKLYEEFKLIKVIYNLTEYEFSKIMDISETNFNNSWNLIKLHSDVDKKDLYIQHIINAIQMYRQSVCNSTTRDEFCNLPLLPRFCIFFTGGVTGWVMSLAIYELFLKNML